jgi:hypothetical protein
VSNQAEFGHGFAIGGAAIAALLGIDAHAADLGYLVLNAHKHGLRLQACGDCRMPNEAAAEAAIAVHKGESGGGEGGEDIAQLARFLRALEEQQRVVAYAAPLVTAQSVQKDAYRQKKHTLFRPPTT